MVPGEKMAIFLFFSEMELCTKPKRRPHTLDDHQDEVTSVVLAIGGLMLFGFRELVWCVLVHFSRTRTKKGNSLKTHEKGNFPQKYEKGEFPSKYEKISIF